MKRFKIMMAAASILCFAFTSCSSDDDPNPAPNDENNERQDILLTSDESVIVSKQIDFAFNFFGRIAGTKGNENVITSPISVYTALSMLSNGADAEIQAELIAALGAPDLNTLNTLNKKLSEELLKADKKVSIAFANSAWCDKSLEFSPAFANALSSYFNAETMKANLATTEGINMFNSWCSQKTNGMITNMLNGPQNISVMLANATIFKGDWKTPFSVNKTSKELFKAVEGSIKVDMMNILSNFSYTYEIGTAAALRLPYCNGAFRMTVILPIESGPINEFAKSFTSTQWFEINKNMKFEEVSVKLPKFKEKCNLELLDMLKDWMPTSFTGEYANMVNKNVMVTSVLQNTAIEVNEEGTKVETVSNVIGGVTDAGAGYFHADRPFMFVIDEVSTGAILFIGTVNTIEQ